MVTRQLPTKPIDAVRPVEPFRPIDTIPVLIPGLFNPSHTTSLFDTPRRGPRRRVVEERLVYTEFFAL
ncbi:MAG: hypothetical protein ABIR56_11150 [Polaromonas sp.]